MKTFSAHLETLPDAQRALLPKLREIPDLGFTLYGGTALALRLGHRVSVDFDFFTELKLDRVAIDRLAVLQGASVFQDERDAFGAIVGGDPGGVKTRFSARSHSGAWEHPNEPRMETSRSRRSTTSLRRNSK